MNEPASTSLMVRYLQRYPLFEALSTQEASALAAIAFIQDLPAGRTLWSQGSPGDRYCLVIRGHLEAKSLDAENHEQILAKIGPGEGIGEASLFLGENHDATVIAISPCRLLVIPRREFQQLLDNQPQIAEQLRPREEICQALEAPHFSWQQPEERIMRLQYRHPLAFFSRIFWVGLFLALTLPLFYFFHWPLLLLAIPAAIAIGWSLWLFLDWRNDYLAVTNQRLVHNEKQLLLYERQEQAPLDKIQDLTVLRRGLGSALFGYGDITIETAGTSGQIIFSLVAHPEAIKEAVFVQIERYRAQQRAERRNRLESELRQQLGLTNPNVAPIPQTSDKPPFPVAPQGPLDAAALQLTEFIRHGFPRLRQQDGDVILWRQHWIILFRALAWPVLATVLFATLPLLTHLKLPWYVMAGVGLTLLIWFWWQGENWRNDVYILTPDRVIDITSIPLRLHTERREGNLANIQNITFIVPNFFANMLNYGNVIIETAGQIGNFTFDNVYDPAGVQADIFQYLEAFRTKEQTQQNQEQNQAIADLLAAYERVREEKRRQ